LVTELKILGSKVDLYKDENIDVINSVLDIKDITKNTNAFTRGFTVPASANNNQLFKHYYDADLDNSFDARTKISAEILLDGISFKTGFIQLTKVNVKKNKPTSYTVNFSGKLNGIKQTLRNDKLKDLNLTAYDHSYNSANVLDGLTGSVPLNLDGVSIEGSIIYNLLAKKQYFYTPDPDNNVQTETSANIAFEGGDLVGVNWFDLRPSLKLIKIIEAVETDYNITFSRHFFDTIEFQGLFMWLNPDGKRDALQFTDNMTFDTIDASGSPPWMDLSTNIATVERAFDKQHGLSFSPIFQSGYEDVEYTVNIFRDGVVVRTYTDTGIIEDTRSTVTDFDLPYGSYEYTATVTTEEAFLYTPRLNIVEYDEGFFDTNVGEVDTGAIANTISTSIIRNVIPDMKIIDFLKGIFNMFKLVIIADETIDGYYYVNTLEGYYSEGVSYDVTKYIDLENWEVERGKILNEIKFKFQEPTTILNLQYEKNEGFGFGDLELTLRSDMNDPTSEMLDGESFEIELPFEQIVYENLKNTETRSETSIIIGTVTDELLEPVSPKAHIFYNYQKAYNSSNIAFINDAGTKVSLGGSNIPLHGNVITNPSYSTTFSNPPNVFDGVYMENNLYSNHYENYISDIFNIKKRTWKYKSYLPLNIMLKLGLNDTLIIKNRYYRIDKYSYNIITGETNFELVNNFDTSIVGALKTISNYIFTNASAKTESVYIANLTGSTFNKVDLGHGTSWVSVVAVETAATQENILELTFTANTLPSQRNLNLEITSAKGELITLYLVQYASNLTVDNTTITVDTTLITADNEQANN